MRQRVEVQLLAVHGRFTWTDGREPARIHELEAEREVIDAERDELVVAREVAFRTQLDADEQAHLLLDRLDVRLDELEAVHALVAAVQVDERGTGLVLRRPASLDHIVDRLDVRLVCADVVAGRAEPALQRGRRLPEGADRVHIDGQVGPLHHADARHRHAPRRLARIPCRSFRQSHRILGEVPLVDDPVSLGAAADEVIRRPSRERFVHRHVDPDLRLQRRAGRDRDLETGAQPCPRPRDAPRAVERHALRDDHPAAEQIDLELAGVTWHGERRGHRRFSSGRTMTASATARSTASSV